VNSCNGALELHIFKEHALIHSNIRFVTNIVSSIQKIGFIYHDSSIKSNLRQLNILIIILEN
jgi:hypothetical protein